MAKALREVGGEQATDLAHQALEVALSIGGTSNADTKLLAEVSPPAHTWSLKFSLPQDLEGNATNFALHKALTLIGWWQVEF